jgi:arylsulfatase A-like enzyme
MLITTPPERGICIREGSRVSRSRMMITVSLDAATWNATNCSPIWYCEPKTGVGHHSRPRAAYAAMVNDLDRYVGKVIATLKLHSLDQKTLVVFTSDNGATHPQPRELDFHVGGADIKFFESTRHLRGYKDCVYEGGIRVPTRRDSHSSNDYGGTSGRRDRCG